MTQGDAASVRQGDVTQGVLRTRPASATHPTRDRAKEINNDEEDNTMSNRAKRHKNYGVRAERLPDNGLDVRPAIEGADLALLYRDECNRTGTCPGCEVEVNAVPMDNGVAHLTYAHDEDCPVVANDFAKTKNEGSE